MPRRPRTIAKCKNVTKVKLIVRVQTNDEKPINGVTVKAHYPETEENFYHKTEPLFRHTVKKKRKKKKDRELDGVAHFGNNMKTGEYKVSVSNCVPTAETTVDVKKIKGVFKRKRTRRKPNITLKVNCIDCDDERVRGLKIPDTVYKTVTDNLGYVAAAYTKQEYNEKEEPYKKQLLCRITSDEVQEQIAKAYELVQTMFGGNECENPSEDQLAGLLNQMEEDATVNGWGPDATKDPRTDNLDGDDARLIVHAFTAIAPMESDKVPPTLAAYKDTSVNKRLFPSDNWVGVRTCISYLDKPEHPGGKYCLSTSLIGKTKKGTINPVGIILNVPVWNLLLIGPTDLTIENGTFQGWSLKRLARGQESSKEISKNGEQTSLEAIQAYNPAEFVVNIGKYSELGVMGTCLRGSEPEVTGIFVVVKNGHLCEESRGNNWKFAGNAYKAFSYYQDFGMLEGKGNSMVERIAKSARDNNIPIIVIKNDSIEFPESDIKLSDLTKSGGPWEKSVIKNF